MDRCVENVIEFIKDQERATATFSQGRYKTKIKKLSEKYPEECQIIAENKDGSICAHLPVKWVKIGPPRAVSENQREAARRNVQNARVVQEKRGENRFL